MTYTPKTAMQLRDEEGSLLAKMAAENGRIGTEIGLHKRKFVKLTPEGATLATSGIDLGAATDIEIHGHFFPKAVTLVAMHDYITEVYAKDAADAKLEVYNDAGAPVKLFGRTLAAAGEAAKSKHTTAPEAGAASVAAGTGISLKATTTGAGGTGHAVVILEYIEA